MKSIKLMSLGLVIFSTVTLGASFAQAADPVANTDADVKFVVDDGEGEPMNPKEPEVVDPTDPTGPGKEVDPGEEGSGGNGTKSFNINWVSNFKFGEIKIGSTTMTAFSAPTTLTWKDGSTPTIGLANFLQVTDNRGTNEGWRVDVTGTPFYELDGAGEKATPEVTLAGASITLNEGNIVGNTTTQAAADLAPKAFNTGVDILGTGSPYTVMQAEIGKGQGTWAVNWGADNNGTALKDNAGVQLSVPVSAQPKANKDYRSTLKWTLMATPNN